MISYSPSSQFEKQMLTNSAASILLDLEDSHPTTILPYA